MKNVDLFSTALESLKRNKGRSILTILGIVIGIASVILMLSIGRGAEGLILNEITDLGADLVFAEPSSGDPTSGPPNPFVEQTLDMDDYDAIKRSGLFSAVDAGIFTSVAISRGEDSVFAQVVGMTENYLDLFPADLNNGRFFTEADITSKSRVAVLGSEIATDLFGDADPVGGRIKIKNVSMKVIGVMEPQGTRFFQNLDTQISVPITTVQRDILGVEYVNFFTGKAIGDLEYTKDELKWLLRDEHDIDNPEGDPDKDDFFVSSQEDAAEIIGVVGNVLSLLLVSIAAISLLVGGIGIMNIMLVSVTERTKEIGLRKSVGATYDEILKQFLLEAVLLTLLGGIVGVILGVATAVGGGLIARMYLDGWSIVIPFSAIILAVVVSTVVGVVFGIYPAQRAAKLEPIEALRYE